MFSNEGKKAHKCSKCDGIFRSRCYLEKHISEVHEVKKDSNVKEKEESFESFSKS